MAHPCLKKLKNAQMPCCKTIQGIVAIINIQPILVFLLCLTGLVLPFSIAASNILFAILLLITILSGGWWQGAKAAFFAWPWFFYFFAAYFALMLLGLLWSYDVAWGIRIIPQYWGWLLLPMLVHVFRFDLSRMYFMLALSTGLFLQLLACVAQSWGVSLPVGNGSMATDPAGFIGHIGFGLVYGIWAAWLIHWAHLHTGERGWRWMAYSVSAISFVMIFIVQGRSGYIEATCLLLFIVWQLYLRQLGWRILLYLLPMFALIGVLLSQGNAVSRVNFTIHSLKAFQQGDFSAAEERVSLMYAAASIWFDHPFLGAGTGSFPVLADALQAEYPELGLHYSATEEGVAAHPSSAHNFYLMVLLRWGPLGLFALLGIFYAWYSRGVKSDWRYQHASMLSLSAIGIAVHAMTSLPFEEYYSAIFGVLWCSIGLAGSMACIDTEKNSRWLRNGTTS
ncbi:MAG: O-antigen ligase family protein [Mariprofundaceae bacterium]|nr:O-antigen ligase family protein [Mariprofundaceae bacterium]